MTASAVSILARHARAFHFSETTHEHTRSTARETTLPVEPVGLTARPSTCDVSYGTQLKIADMRLADRRRFRQP